MEGENFRHFGIMIPKYATHTINDCNVFSATGQEFEEFKKWVESGEIIQLKAGEEFIDLWINKDTYGMGRTARRLNQWFDNWKNPPKTTYGYTSFEIK